MISEIFVRLLTDIPAGKEYMRFFSLNFAVIPEKNIDKDLFWVKDPGFRGGIYDKQKDEQCVRIVCLGDSCTEGYRKKINNKQAYPYLLEKKIARDYPGQQIEVINAGRAGYSSLQVLRFLKRDIMQYGPDIVIVWTGIHDRAKAWYFADKDQIVNSPKRGKTILPKSKLLGLVKNIKNIYKDYYSSDLTRVSLVDYENNCVEIIKTVKKQKALPVFIIPFYVDKNQNILTNFKDYAKILKQISEDYDCTVIDLEPVFRKEKDLSDFFLDDCHPTEAGNSLIAGYISKRIKGYIKI
jgi:lysophospholipase L1-like esterase